MTTRRYFIAHEGGRWLHIVDTGGLRQRRNHEARTKLGSESTLMSNLGELWACPECGAKFATEGQWHTCGEVTLGDWIDELGPRGAALYNQFEQMIAACGEYHVAPAKTRIAFMGRVRFATITNISERGMTWSFALPFTLESDRIESVEEVVPGWYVHWIKVVHATQLDSEIQKWIEQSYRLMGMQERLNME